MSYRLWASVALAHLADLWSTVVGLGLGGHEQNPAAAAALGGGLLGLALLKAVGLGSIAGVWALGRRRGVPATWLVPTIAALGGLIPAAWNTSQILLYGGVLG
jgi:hypothetical protein